MPQLYAKKQKNAYTRSTYSNENYMDASMTQKKKCSDPKHNTISDLPSLKTSFNVHSIKNKTTSSSSTPATSSAPSSSSKANQRAVFCGGSSSLTSGYCSKSTAADSSDSRSSSLSSNSSTNKSTDVVKTPSLSSSKKPRSVPHSPHRHSRRSANSVGEYYSYVNERPRSENRYSRTSFHCYYHRPSTSTTETTPTPFAKLKFYQSPDPGLVPTCIHWKKGPTQVVEESSV